MGRGYDQNVATVYCTTRGRAHDRWEDYIPMERDQDDIYINNLVKYICQDSDGRRVRLKQINKSKITRNSNFE